MVVVFEAQDPQWVWLLLGVVLVATPWLLSLFLCGGTWDASILRLYLLIDEQDVIDDEEADDDEEDEDEAGKRHSSFDNGEDDDDDENYADERIALRGVDEEDESALGLDVGKTFSSRPKEQDSLSLPEPSKRRTHRDHPKDHR